ncbi:outer membrane protein assembly factor BamD [Candidatus Pelagibacter sp. HIMB109]|uniref:outer membrane protein assembly factor BamD n=1 Tax=Candidatus Pelagibacter sp. HIMB109 TaxID=3415412 RepID=UPI003F846DAB
MMIISKNNFFLVLIFCISLISCSKKDNYIKRPEKLPPLDVLYKEAFNSYETNQWSDSVELFQKVESRYSFSEWAPKATLMIMYIYYESGEYFKAVEYAKKFKKLYPLSSDLDYVEFIIGLCFYEKIETIARDQSNSEFALKKFNEIIKKYPNSIYATESKYKIDLIKEQLAGKQMYIARYYMDKSRWIPAIKRLKIIIDDYDQTIYITEALHRLVEIYYKLGNTFEAKKYASILGYNFNDSDWYKKSYKIVGDKNYKIVKDNNEEKLTDKLKKIFKFSK